MRAESGGWLMYRPTWTMEAYLNGSWVDITDDVLGVVRGEWGISGTGPTDFVADTGSLEFDLQNYNPVGKYSPGHPNCTSGWKKASPCGRRLPITDIQSGCVVMSTTSKTRAARTSASASPRWTGWNTPRATQSTTLAFWRTNAATRCSRKRWHLCQSRRKVPILIQASIPSRPPLIR